MDIDINVVMRARDGDPDAFIDLYETMYKSLYRSAFLSLGRKEDAEDAVSDTIVDAWNEIGNLRDAKAFCSWIFRILYVKCQRKRAYYMTEPSELKPEGENGDYYIREEGSGAFTRIQSGWTTPTDNDPDVIRALFTLSPEDREIIVLHVIAGFKSREIAQITGLKASTVRSKEARALNKIREVLS
ncbi:MAG: RNA polymerase sigma factor [Lachnospiraceae bacterium]|nr:RNA polymerase sigma factor [Lachnospiraceae bacterium]MCR5212200.1 RNA polymerase sigma factor [Lachnospiraceae bacterium]